jgi:hypothetical protein
MEGPALGVDAASRRTHLTPEGTLEASGRRRIGRRRRAGGEPIDQPRDGTVEELAVDEADDATERPCCCAFGVHDPLKLGDIRTDGLETMVVLHPHTEEGAGPLPAPRRMPLADREPRSQATHESEMTLRLSRKGSGWFDHDPADVWRPFGPAFDFAQPRPGVL